MNRIQTSLIQTSLAALALLTPVAASAATAAEKVTYPISVPQECVELAQREGQPLVIESKVQALRARYKLARLSGKDPLVVQCRAAVERYRAQAQAR